MTRNRLMPPRAPLQLLSENERRKVDYNVDQLGMDDFAILSDPRNVQTRRAFADRTRALGLDVETGGPVADLSGGSQQVADTGPQVAPRPRVTIGPEKVRPEPVGHEALDAERRRYMVGEDFARAFSYRPAEMLGPKWQWGAQQFDRKYTPNITVRGSAQTDQDAIDLKIPKIKRGTTQERAFVNTGSGFFEVPVVPVEDPNPYDGITEAAYTAGFAWC